MEVDVEAAEESREELNESTQHYRSRKHCVPFSRTLWLKEESFEENVYFIFLYNGYYYGDSTCKRRKHTFSKEYLLFI